MQQKSTKKKETIPANSAKSSFVGWKLVFLFAPIAIIALFSFSPALKNSFTNWDDNAYVFENPNLSKPIPDAIQYFFGPHYFIGNYIPVTMITYALEFHEAGLDPQFFHGVNVFIHLLNVLLVFWLARLLSGRKPLVAAIVALFFAIHPMHVESVAWIAELKDMLYSFFFLAGLITWYKHIEGKKQSPQTNKSPLIFFSLTFLFFLLSLLSKPAALIFPFVLLLLDFYAERKFDKWVWIEKLPFLIVSIIFGIIAIKAQAADRLLHDYYPFSQRLFFASHSLLGYLVKFFLPINLSIFYPYPQLVDGHLPYLYYATPVIVVALFYSVYRTLKQTRLIAFGFLFFFINIILVLQLLSVGDAVMADRYTYIPYIGLLFIIAMGFDKLYQSSMPQLKTYKPVAVTVIIALAVTCSYLTYARCEIWENDDTIATDLLEKFPDDRLALNNEGFILFMQKRYPESIELFTKAVQIKPDYVMAYINLVNSYLAINDMADAVKTADEGLKNAPQDYTILNTKGYLFFAQHNYPEAIKIYNDAIRIKPDNTNGYIHLAQIYYELKDNDNWMKTLDAALKYEPGNFILLNNKGYALFINHRYPEAIEYYKASLKMKPYFTTASINLADCYKAIGKDGGKKK
jgi:Tfp pilus assembly protein PilF